MNGGMWSGKIGDTLDPTLETGPRFEAAEGIREVDSVTSFDTDGTGGRISSVSDGV